MILGIDKFLRNIECRRPLSGRRLAFLGHSASVTDECRSSLDMLTDCSDLRLVAAFGPQHGMRGEKQDNMIESDDYYDSRLDIPVFSLYGKTRRPTSSMMDTFDAVLVDLQDIGTRIYTYLSTLVYMLEACAEHGKSIWILDRPNPAGRPVEGTILEQGWESFVGAAPCIMRHGMTLGELARWYVSLSPLEVEMTVIQMDGYDPDGGPGFGWPVYELAWVNPSPNASGPNMARCYPGTVLFEGTALSEGRGTTHPLEMIGAPDIDFARILQRAAVLSPDWCIGGTVRPCFFEPTFHKHAGKMCSGLQIHTDNRFYRHEQFRPYRLAAILLKAIRLEHPDYPLWRKSPYEYETERLAIDLLSGGAFLRTWVDDPATDLRDLEERLKCDENRWCEIRAPFLIYRSSER